MRNLSTLGHRWLILAEHGALRAAMIAIGLLLALYGLALTVSIVMLVPGIAIGLAGVALVVGGAVVDLPLGD